MTDELPEVPLAPDADVVRRLALAQDEINNLNETLALLDARLGSMHKELMEAHILIHDLQDNAGAAIHLEHGETHARLVEFTAANGRPRVVEPTG